MYYFKCVWNNLFICDVEFMRYLCDDCGEEFDEADLDEGSGQPACPKCGSVFLTEIGDELCPD